MHAILMIPLLLAATPTVSDTFDGSTTPVRVLRYSGVSLLFAGSATLLTGTVLLLDSTERLSDGRARIDATTLDVGMGLVLGGSVTVLASATLLILSEIFRADALRHSQLALVPGTDGARLIFTARF